MMGDTRRWSRIYIRCNSRLGFSARNSGDGFPGLLGLSTVCRILASRPAAMDAEHAELVRRKSDPVHCKLCMCCDV